MNSITEMNNMTKCQYMYLTSSAYCFVEYKDEVYPEYPGEPGVILLIDKKTKLFTVTAQGNVLEYFVRMYPTDYLEKHDVWFCIPKDKKPIRVCNDVKNTYADRLADPKERAHHMEWRSKTLVDITPTRQIGPHGF